MDQHFAWVQSLTTLLLPEHTKVEHDPSLGTAFHEGKISHRESGGLWSANVNLIAESCEPATTRTVALELSKRYKGPSIVWLLYGSRALGIDSVHYESLLADDVSFVYAINGGWPEGAEGHDGFMLRYNGAVIDRHTRLHTLQRQIVPQRPDSTEASLIEAVRHWGNLALHHGVAISAQGQPTILRTSVDTRTLAHYPGLGWMPKGLRGIDLTTWNGRDRNLSKADVVSLTPSA